jgi:LysR family transcriptional regulator, transcriptional activator of the cysJI operon
MAPPIADVIESELQNGTLEIREGHLTIGQYLLPTFEALLARDIQLALIEGPERRKDFHIEPFMEDHMVLVVPATHGWADHEIKIEDLKSEPLLMREFGSGSRRVVEQALSNAGVKTKDLTISMQLDSTEGLLYAVEAGLGITFVSRWAVRNQLSLGTLKIARVQGLKLARRFSMAYPAGPEPIGVVGIFRKFLLSQAMETAPKRTGRVTAS